MSPLSSIQIIRNGGLGLYGGAYENLNGLENLIETGFLSVNNCNNLLDFRSLESLQKIGAGYYEPYLLIKSCESLLSMTGLESVTEFDIQLLRIAGNRSLANLDGLENLNSLSNISLGRSLCSDSDFNLSNESLTDFCGISNLMVNGTYESYYIIGSPYRPSIADFQNGDCSI